MSTDGRPERDGNPSRIFEVGCGADAGAALTLVAWWDDDSSLLTMADCGCNVN